MPPKRNLEIKAHKKQESRREVRSSNREKQQEVIASLPPDAFANSAAGMEEAPTLPALPQDALTVVCVVNNRQNMSLIMDPTDTYQAVQADVQPDIQHKPLFNARMEIEVLWCTPFDNSGHHRQGTLIIDDEVVFNLGPLRVQPVHCAILVEKFPTKFELRVQAVASPAVHPSEWLLVRAVKALLDEEEFLGSLGLSHLQNLVRDLPYYLDVVGPIRKDFGEMLNAHLDLWKVFKYSPEYIEEHGIQQTCRKMETRVVSLQHLGCYEDGDIARDRIRRKCEQELHECLKQKLIVRAYPQQELQAELAKESCFLTLIAPNYPKIMEHYASQPDKYFVMFNRLHDIFIEKRRHDIGDPFLAGDTSMNQDNASNLSSEANVTHSDAAAASDATSLVDSLDGGEVIDVTGRPRGLAAFGTVDEAEQRGAQAADQPSSSPSPVQPHE